MALAIAEEAVFLFGFFIQMGLMPAVLLIGFWFLLQVFSEVGSVAQPGHARGVGSQRVSLGRLNGRLGGGGAPHETTTATHIPHVKVAAEAVTRSGPIAPGDRHAAPVPGRHGNGHSGRILAALPVVIL
jgi:hypothetical protein